MIYLTAILIGVFFTAGTYLILQKGFVRILFGFSLLNHAANLTVLAVSGNPQNKLAPIVEQPKGIYVDPLPQALILTAIVIGFGVTAYMVVLMYRIYLDNKTTNLRSLFGEKNL